jgi:predicted RNase H-like HicB family nuclease
MSSKRTSLEANTNYVVGKYVYWQDEEMWLGYLEEYPEYRTQGETKEELEENLKDIFAELTSGNIPCVRRVDQLEVA